MSKYRVLFVGESWMTHNMEVKGWDDFSIGGYGTEIDRVRGYMDKFAELIHMPAHEAGERFPASVKELEQYDMVILSDIGANTLLLHPSVFYQSKRYPNRLKVIEDYVLQGGAFGMMGGYMTFQGIGGKGCYHGTPVERVLPVDMFAWDDRQEHPEGIDIKVEPSDHPILAGIPADWPYLLGYNKLIPKPEAKVLVEYEGDPILAVGEFGKGRSFAWASDCAPHWMPQQFCEWDYNPVLWKNILDWTIRR